MEATQTTQITPPTHVTDTRRAHRRRWVVAAALLLVLLLLMLASLGSTGTPGAAPGQGTADDVSRQSGTTAGTTTPDEDALDAADDSGDFSEVDLVDSDGGGSDPGDADFDPVGDGDPVDPCVDHVAGDGALLVVPDPVVLPDSDMDDQLHIRNCSGASVEWTASTKPSVTLGAAGGTLAPGEVTPLAFTIQKDQWEPGAIDFKIKVSEPGFNEYIDVHAYRPLVGADMVASTDISVGPHIGGCADQCISKALITRAITTPDVSLEVGTTVKAKVRVYLSKNAPVEGPGGNPKFPGVPPKATSPDSAMSWTTPLSNLQPATKYFIIVKATDVDGDTAYRSGSFRTITPHEGPDELAPADYEPGCASQCITKAVVTPGEGLAPSHLSVRTHTPAKLQLYISRGAPIWDGEVPHFADVDGARNSGDALVESWETDLTGLDPSTTWHGIVRATDANGHKAYAVGSFVTDGVDVRITLHKVHLTQDGDSQSWNRGEVRFAWGVGEDTVGITGEYKLDPGSERGFGDHSTYVVHDANELPTVYVTAYERDPDGLVEFCSAGDGPRDTPGSDKKCDVKWNVATSDALDVGDLDDLDDCDGTPCQVLYSEDLGDDYPEFWALVSYEVLG